MLWRVGVLRHGVADDIEIWSADLPLKEKLMQNLMREAMELVGIWERNSCVVMYGEDISNFKWDPRISVANLRKTTMSYFGLAPDLKLLHLGFELQSGLLVNYGVGPGSIIVLGTP
eukprot:8507725-Karenia_brevis.AAC.1